MTDAARWRRLQDLFLDARAATDERRERLLREWETAEPELAAEVRDLLAADAASGPIDALQPRLESVARLLDEPAPPCTGGGAGRQSTDPPPDRIGAYRIVSEIGRGGMGAVYLGERADGQFEQRVAIKLIGATDAGDPLHQRFLAERQILAALTHPNIARLLDGGITVDGRPYLVMEYVDGMPITTYCDTHHLTVRERLRLFADVCAAVQHAHRNLVVHRDLKPSNILVSAGHQVHLLDFGIAKLLRPSDGAIRLPATREKMLPMTPEYASPEQVRGEVLTTASDVYSLGVLLYELLCGLPPYRLTTSSPAELAAAVRDQDTIRPSDRISGAEPSADSTLRRRAAERRGTSVDRLAGQLGGDLDSIVMMALRKEPDLRYASVDMLRQDLERHLEGQPVLAHRGGARYRAERFVRRHRVEVAAAAVVLVSLVTGLGLAVDQGRRARADRDRAKQALAESEGVTDFLIELYQTGDANERPTAQLSALDLLHRGAARADELADQPIVHARLLDVVGQMSLHLGQLDEARRRLEQAVAVRRATLGPASLDLASSLIQLARVHRTRSAYDRARPLVAEALSIRERALPPDHPDIADALYELGWISFGAEQEQVYRRALNLISDTPETAERRMLLLQALSTNLRRQGMFDAAVAADRDALRVVESTFGNDHHLTGYAMIHLADHVRDIEGDLAAAERLYRRGLELTTARFGENSVRLIHGLHSLSELLAERDEAEAEALLRRALAIRRSATGPEHALVADQLARLAALLTRRGRLEEADSLARAALEMTIRTLGPTHPAVASARLPVLAEVLDRQGRYDEADRTFMDAFEQITLEGVVPGQMRRDYGRMLMRRGDFHGAERELLQSLTLLEGAYAGQEHPNVQETQRALMQLYQRWGKPELAERVRVPPGRFVPY